MHISTHLIRECLNCKNKHIQKTCNSNKYCLNVSNKLGSFHGNVFSLLFVPDSSGVFLKQQSIVLLCVKSDVFLMVSIYDRQSWGNVIWNASLLSLPLKIETIVLHWRSIDINTVRHCSCLFRGIYLASFTVPCRRKPIIIPRVSTDRDFWCC